MNGEKKYWLSWELNPDHLPSACNQQDLLGRNHTIRPLSLVVIPRRSVCSCASFSLLLGGRLSSLAGTSEITTHSNISPTTKVGNSAHVLYEGLCNQTRYMYVLEGTFF